MFKTLIVEDNAAFRRQLSKLLHANYPAMMVAEAKNNGEAWKKLFDFQPDLVFVDIKLQDESGLDLTSDIRKASPEVIVVVITGHNFPEYRQAAYQNGAHYFIPKSNAKVADFLMLIDSIQTGQPPQWSLGAEYINPAPLVRPWKK